MSLLLILAQAASSTPQDRTKLVVALAILMGLVLVGGFGIILLRRKLYSSSGNDDTPDVGFSLSDLRKMRDRGEITPEEYEVTRNKVIAKVKSSMEAKPKPKTRLGDLDED